MIVKLKTLERLKREFGFKERYDKNLKQKIKDIIKNIETGYFVTYIKHPEEKIFYKGIITGFKYCKWKDRGGICEDINCKGPIIINGVNEGCPLYGNGLCIIKSFIPFSFLEKDDFLL